MKTPIVMRVIAASSAAVGLFLPPASIPSYAADPVVVLNGAGGTSASDGLKVQAANGVVQITRAGQAQVMDGSVAPTGDFVPANLLQNTFLVLSTTPDPTVIGLNTKLSAPGMLTWDSAATSVASADGLSGVVTSVLTKDLDGNPATTNDIYSVTWALNVKQSSPTAQSTFTVTLPKGSPAARLYWVTTPDLGSKTGVLTTYGAARLHNPDVVITAVTPDVTDSQEPIAAADRSAQGVHQMLGATKFRWFVGSTYCVAADCVPVSDDPEYGAPADANGNAGGWVMRATDLPNWANPYTSTLSGVGVDSALAIQYPATTTSAVYQAQWTLASMAVMNSVLARLQRVSPTYAVAPKSLKVGKSAVLVTKVGFPAVTLSSSTPRMCTIKTTSVTGKAKGACTVKAFVAGVAVKTIKLTIVK